MTQRFVSVIGPGGIGKTTVALAVANTLRPAFDEGRICVVDGGAITDPAELPGAIAAALGCSARLPDPMPNIVAWMSARPTMLILDSCEHLIEAAASLSELLHHAAPTVHILATSREALRVEGEHVHVLPPLHFPLDDTPTAVVAMATPAVQLFMERAAASGHLERLSDADAPIVSSICRRLDGIALAIELVASRVGVYGIHGTADLLEGGAEFVLQGRRNAAPRHQTLQALYDWSYRLLSPDEQRVLARLSVFAGELTMAAAHVVVGDADDDAQAISRAVASLADKSLIQISTGNGTAGYRLLDTTRAYAGHKLAERGEEEEMARRHARYVASILEQTDARAPAPGERQSGEDRRPERIRPAMGVNVERAADTSTEHRRATATAEPSSEHSSAEREDERRLPSADLNRTAGHASTA